MYSKKPFENQYLVQRRVIERMWSDVGETNEQPCSTVHVGVLLDRPHRVQQLTFVICDENVIYEYCSAAFLKHFYNEIPL